MKFYTFNQNNSGGSFDFDEEKGITHFVIIEAESADAANEIAESKGVYFNGCDDGLDCDCCGDRWWPVSDRDGETRPEIYGQHPYTYDSVKFMAPKPEACILFADGRKEWY